MRFSTSERQLVLLCMAVLFGSFASAKDTKSGKCPTVVFDCPTVGSMESCILDSDCSRTDKCCSNGCSLVCTDVEVPPEPLILKGDPGDPGEPGEQGHYRVRRLGENGNKGSKGSRGDKGPPGSQ